MRYFAAHAFLLLAACTSAPPIERNGAPTSPDPAHSSRTSLDWAGAYVGTLPCADCPGIETRLTLDANGGYRLATRYIGRQTEPDTFNGRFEWTYDGNHIQLDAAADNAFYQVREGTLLRRYADGTWPQADRIPVMSLHREP